MNKHFHSLCLLVAVAAKASGTVIFAPGDPILGGARVGDNFEVGAIGTAGGVNNWPGAEPPADLIDGVIGGGMRKVSELPQIGHWICHHSGIRVFSRRSNGALGRE